MVDREKVVYLGGSGWMDGEERDSMLIRSNIATDSIGNRASRCVDTTFSLLQSEDEQHGSEDLCRG